MKARKPFILAIVFNLFVSLIIPCTQLQAEAQSSPQSTRQNSTVLDRAPQITTLQNQADIFFASPRPFVFGVINDHGSHYDDEYSRGVRATNLEIQWKKYEPEEGIYDTAYIQQMKTRLQTLKQNGWIVQLIPGFQYTPGWVFTNYPNMYYVNQYGENYNPDPATKGDFRVINAPFNTQARVLISRYINHLLTVSFPQTDPALRFDSIRIGGGVQGELRYPPKDWNGHPNSYWAFDIYAQDPAQIGGIPGRIVGWKPGIDENPGTVGHGQLIINPGFEQIAGFYPVLGWSPDNEVQASPTPLVKYSGNQSLELTIKSSNRIHQLVRVTPGQTYHFGAWVMSGDGEGHARVFINQYDANYQILSTAPFAKLSSTSSEWSYVEGSLTAVAGAKFFKVELDGDRNGVFYFDDLWMEKAGESEHQSRDIEVPVAFYDWYITALTNYQNWQVNEYRNYFPGRLDLTLAGKGINTYQITAALVNDLKGDGWSEKSNSLYAGSVYERLVAGLDLKGVIGLYVTGIEADPVSEVDDTSLYPNQWSAAHWIAYLARQRNLPVWGENTGENNVNEMWLAAGRAFGNGFSGMMWGFESELYISPNPDGYATIDDYQAIIDFYQNLKFFYLPLNLYTVQ